MKIIKSKPINNSSRHQIKLSKFLLAKSPIGVVVPILSEMVLLFCAKVNIHIKNTMENKDNFFIFYALWVDCN